MGKNLPIYTEYQRGGNVCFTLIKKVSGDTRTLIRELKDHFLRASDGKTGEKDLVKLKKMGDKWRMREELGHIWVYGRHPESIRKFLESKGF